MATQSGGDINPLDSVRMQIDPERRKREKEEEDPKKDEENEEEKSEENVLVDIHKDKSELPHVKAVDNKDNPDAAHENGKGDLIDYTV